MFFAAKVGTSEREIEDNNHIWIKFNAGTSAEWQCTRTSAPTAIFSADLFKLNYCDRAEVFS